MGSILSHYIHLPQTHCYLSQGVTVFLYIPLWPVLPWSRVTLGIEVCKQRNMLVDSLLFMVLLESHVEESGMWWLEHFGDVHFSFSSVSLLDMRLGWETREWQASRCPQNDLLSQTTAALSLDQTWLPESCIFYSGSPWNLFSPSWNRYQTVLLHLVSRIVVIWAS